MQPEVSAASSSDSSLTTWRGGPPPRPGRPSARLAAPLCCLSPSLPLPGRPVMCFFLSVRSVMIPVSHKGHSVNEMWHHCREAVFKLKYYRKGSTLQTFDVTAPVSKGSCEYSSHCRLHKVHRHCWGGEERADRVNKNNSSWVSEEGAGSSRGWTYTPMAPGSGK